MKKRLKTERPDLSRNRKLFHLFLEINSNETFDIYQRIMLSPTVKIKTKKKENKEEFHIPCLKKEKPKTKKTTKTINSADDRNEILHKYNTETRNSK